MKCSILVRMKNDIDERRRNKRETAAAVFKCVRF